MKKYILLTALLFLGLGLILIEFNYQLAVSEARQSEGTDEAGERAFYERGFLTPETTKARATYNFLTMDCKYKIHYCNWGDCDHIGTSNFKQRWNNPKNTAGHYAELLHFYNPDLSYEEVEEIILFPTESGAIEQAVNE